MKTRVIGLGQRHGVCDPIGQYHPERARPVRHAEEPVVALPARASAVGLSGAKAASLHDLADKALAGVVPEEEAPEVP